MIEKIFILENPKIEGIQKEKEKIEKLFKSCGKVVEKEFKSSDLIVTMGGDGTILKAISLLKDTKNLIYGIKYGKTGFLTNQSENLEEKIKNVIGGKYKVCKRMLLEVEIKRSGKIVYKDKVLNDFLFFRKGIRIIEIEVQIEENKVMEFRGDGVIISTPTGSTAHSLSAGGPIIYPETESILITPVCPYSLSIRPLIIPSKYKIKLKIKPNGKIICDGQRKFEMEQEDIAEIKKSKIKANLILEDNFFDKLKTKFNFGK